MSHPVADHPILSKVAPDLVERVLAHTSAVVTMPPDLKQKTLELSETNLTEKLIATGMELEDAVFFGGVTKAAVEANIESLGKIARDNGMSLLKLVFIATLVQESTMKSIEKALAAKA